MKLVINGSQEFSVNKSPNLSGDPISFSLDVDDPSTIPTEITGDIILKDIIVWPKTGIVEEGEDTTDGVEEEFVLYQTTAESWLRHYTSGNTLFFTNIPEPEPPVPPTEEELEEIRKQKLQAAKTEKIKLSNDLLEEFLATHPITWVDGQQYSVTEEKQGLLTSNIALYQLSVQAGKPRELKWNTTGDVCTVWTIENLSALALAIGDYVQPYVTYQQTVEVQIKNCATMEELEAIVIDYSTVSTVKPEVLTGEQGS